MESAPGAATEEAENAEVARLADGGRQARPRPPTRYRLPSPLPAVRPPRKPRTQRLPASPKPAGSHASTANAIQAPFAATGDDDGQLHEPNTTEVSAWGGLSERLTMSQESACRPAVRRAAERSCEQSGGETRVGGIGLVAG